MNPEGKGYAPLFRLGQVVATPGALEALQEAGQDPRALLQRHRPGTGAKCQRRTRKRMTSACKKGFAFFRRIP
jgi:hypothetical protein